MQEQEGAKPKYTPEEKGRLQASRTLSDADAIDRGRAEYFGEEGELLNFSSFQAAAKIDHLITSSGASEEGQEQMWERVYNYLHAVRDLLTRI
jgi:hypothetical protein